MRRVRATRRAPRIRWGQAWRVWNFVRALTQMAENRVFSECWCCSTILRRRTEDCIERVRLLAVETPDGKPRLLGTGAVAHVLEALAMIDTPGSLSPTKGTPRTQSTRSTRSTMSSMHWGSRRLPGTTCQRTGYPRSLHKSTMPTLWTLAGSPPNEDVSGFPGSPARLL